MAGNCCSRGASITSDTSGNIYVVGTITDPVFDGNVSHGFKDIVIVKYNASGNRLWTRRFGGSENADKPFSIIFTATNKLVVTGTTRSPDFDNHQYSLPDEADAIFIKTFTTDGEEGMSRLIPGTAGQILTDTTSDNAGNIYITGHAYESYQGKDSNGRSDLFITKLDDNGIIIWNQFLGGASWEIPYDIKVDSVNNVYITGTTYTVNFDSQTESNDYDSFLLKLDSNGDKIWAQTLSTEGVDRVSVVGHSISLHENNKIHLVGFSDAEHGSTLDGHQLIYAGDFFTLSYDTDGNKLASDTLEIGSPNNSYITFGEDKHIYVITSNDLNSFESYSNLGLNDIYIVKFDLAGTKLATKQFGGSGNDYVAGETAGIDHNNGIFIQSDGTFYLTGHTQNLYGNNQFEGLDNNASSREDMFIIRDSFVSPSDSTAATGKLNDTGITKCANASWGYLSCPISDYLNQDAETGRDAQFQMGTLPKIGGGDAGFDFTELNNGECVKDNHTGLTWEVKSTESDSLHNANYTYTWYNTNSNIGVIGTQNGGTCFGSNCDTLAFIEAVNNSNYCGYDDWRLPTREELRSLVKYDGSIPAIDLDYFPNTKSFSWNEYFYWSSSLKTDLDSSNLVWGIHFANRNGRSAHNSSHSEAHYIRLVR